LETLWKGLNREREGWRRIDLGVLERVEDGEGEREAGERDGVVAEEEGEEESFPVSLGRKKRRVDHGVSLEKEVRDGERAELKRNEPFP